MQDFSAVLGNAVTGLFTLLGAFLVWRLRRKDEEGDRRTAIKRENRKDLVDLYALAFTSFEQAMKCVFEQQPYELTIDRSLVNAKIRLLGSEPVNLAFDDVTEKLQAWSVLSVAASPRHMKVGDQIAVVIQAPDPTAKFKAAAQEAHEALHNAIQILRSRMKSDLSEV